MTPRAWRDIQIGDLGQVVTGHTPPRGRPEYFGSEYPWIKPTDIRIGYRHVEKPEEYFSELAFQRYRNAFLPPMSTCVVTIGTVGEKVCLTRRSSFTNQSINAIVPDGRLHDKMFVYYLMKYNLPKVANANPGTASGRHHVSKSNFCDIQVSVPPLGVQRKIARMLSACDDAIESNLRRIEILEEIAARTYREWFVRFRFPGNDSDRFIASTLGLVPKGWKACRLAEVATVNADTLGRSGVLGEIRYVDISSVGEGRVESAAKMDFRDAPGRARRIVRSGDIIWSMVRPNLRSFALILDPCENMVVSTGFAVITPNKLPFSYLYHALTTDEFVTYLSNHATGAAYPAVHSEDFENALVLVPTEPILDRFRRVVDPILWQRHTIERLNATLRNTRDLMLPKLLSGRVDVTAIEETASGASA